MLVDPTSVATEVVIAFLAVNALITPRLADKFNMSVQIVIRLLQRGACTCGHGVTSCPMQAAM